MMDKINKRIDIIINNSSSIDEKLLKICQLLKNEIDGFDWVGFYFQDNEQQILNLGPYAGAATEHTKIPFGKGICGQVAVSNKTFISQDVTAEDNYLACSIDTQSEIVVPIFKNGVNIGQIDIDSHQKNAISQEKIALLENLTKKISAIL